MDSGDDLFGDLLGTNGGSRSPATSGSTSGAGGKQAMSGKTVKEALPSHKSKPLSDVFNANNGNSTAVEDKPSSEPQPPAAAIPGVSKEELHAVVSGAVQAALDATFGKFVKSLRTVLEDLGKRVDNNGHAITEVRTTLGEISDLLDSQAQNFHARFHGLDMSIKDIDRGVQSLRDKQELNEAQAMLAKLAHAETAVAGAAAGPTPPAASSTGGAVTGAAAPAPASIPASAAPAAAPAPAPSPSPQPAAAAPVAPAPAPAPAQQHQQQYAQPPPVQQQQQHSFTQPHAAPQQQLPVPQQHPDQQHYSAPGPQYAPYSPPQASAPSQSMAPPVGPPAPAPMAEPYHPAPGYPHGPPQNSHYAAVPPTQQMHSAPPMPAPMPMPMPQPAPLQQQPSLPQQPIMPPLVTPHSGGSFYGGGPQPSGPSYPAPALSYPAPPQGSAYPAPYRTPGPPPGLQTMNSANSSGAGGGPARTNTRSVRLEDIIADITQMGFERHQVMAVINSMQKAGQAVDLNVVIDRLTNGRY